MTIDTDRDRGRGDEGRGIGYASYLGKNTTYNSCNPMVLDRQLKFNWESAQPIETSYAMFSWWMGFCGGCY